MNTHINSRVCSIGEVRQGPAGVGQYLFVAVIDEGAQGREDANNNLLWWVWVLVTAQIGHGPTDVTKVVCLDWEKTTNS